MSQVPPVPQAFPAQTASPAPADRQVALVYLAQQERVDRPEQQVQLEALDLVGQPVTTEWQAVRDLPEQQVRLGRQVQQVGLVS